MLIQVWHVRQPEQNLLCHPEAIAVLPSYAGFKVVVAVNEAHAALHAALGLAFKESRIKSPVSS